MASDDRIRENKVHMIEQKGLTYTALSRPLSTQSTALNEFEQVYGRYLDDAIPTLDALAKQVRRVSVPISDVQDIVPVCSLRSDAPQGDRERRFCVEQSLIHHTTSSEAPPVEGPCLRRPRNIHKRELSKIREPKAIKSTSLDTLDIEALIGSYRSMIHPSVRERLLERQASIISRMEKGRLSNRAPLSTDAVLQQRRIKSSGNASVIAGEIIDSDGADPRLRKSWTTDYFAQSDIHQYLAGTTVPVEFSSRNISNAVASSTPTEHRQAFTHSRSTSRTSTNISHGFRWSMDSRATHCTKSTSYTGTGAAVSDSVHADINISKDSATVEIHCNNAKGRGHTQQSSIDSMASLAMSEPYNDASIYDFPEPPSTSRRPSQQGADCTLSEGLISRANSQCGVITEAPQPKLPLRPTSVDGQASRPESRRSARSTTLLGLTVHTSAPVRRVATLLS